MKYVFALNSSTSDIFSKIQIPTTQINHSSNILFDLKSVNLFDSILISNTSILSVVILFVYNLFLLYLFIFFTTSSVVLLGSDYFNFLLVRLLDFLEQEVNSINNLMWFGSLFISLFTYYYISWFFNGNINPIHIILGYTVLMICVGVFCIPCYMMFNYGFFFLPYIAGSTTKKSFLVTFLTDSLNMIAYFFRINIQLIRLILILSTFLMYNEMYTTFGKHSYNNLGNLLTGDSYLDMICYSIGSFVGILCRMFFELGHFWVIFFMQGTTFSMLLLVLIQFLYTAFVVKKMSNYFASKRI